MSTTRDGWMVCDINEDPCGPIYPMREHADEAVKAYPRGCGYHVRPVEVQIAVRGQAPKPWLFVASSPSPDPEA